MVVFNDLQQIQTVYLSPILTIYAQKCTFCTFLFLLRPGSPSHFSSLLTIFFLSLQFVSFLSLFLPKIMTEIEENMKKFGNFEDYQDLSSKNAKIGRCKANSCHNHGKCVEKWPQTSCDCHMTSFTGPSCADGKGTNVEKYIPFTIFFIAQ